MDLAELIISSRSYLDHFNYDEYPACFAAFAAAAIGDPARDADALLLALRGRYDTLSAREKKIAAEQDKQVLALFLTPAALRSKTGAANFARLLCERWNQSDPRNRYFPGEYEIILKGFDANLLGLPLRKSKRR